MGIVRLLLDTCALLWLAGEPARLSVSATAAINDPANHLYLSETSIWEIVLKHSAGKLPLPEMPRVWAPKQIAFFGIQLITIPLEALYRSGELPRIHNDPFDRLLAAQTLTEKFTLVSPDPPFRAFGVDCIW
jgi:PIN domain nuclease of toxin-antitoxin system